MIDRILMELYDEYEKGSIVSLTDFSNKTFPNDGTNLLFIGCTLILFSKCSGYKPRYMATRERLYDILLSSKKTINNKNMLLHYIDNVNKTKGIKKYFKLVDEDNIINLSSVIIEYLDQFSPDFISDLENKKL